MNSKRSLQLAAFAASLVTFMVYFGSFSGDFINYDDKAYLFENPVVRQLDLSSLIAMFTSSHAGWWMPLTWLSFAIDYRIWGLNAFGFHLTNTLIHCANSALVVAIAYLVIKRQGSVAPGPRLIFAAGAGLLWSLHPLRVESVAWIAERKDVLNGFFSLGAVLFYLRCHRDPDAAKPVRTDYFCSLALFYLSLLAKSVSVVLPLVLLALDLYPLKRLSAATVRNRLSEKLPFFAGSLLVVFGTFVTAVRSNYLVSYEMFPFSQRLAVSGNAIIEYCRLFLVPAGLSPLNVIPDPIPPGYALKALITVSVTIVIILCRRFPAVQSCWFCFVLPFLPVLAFFQNGDQAFADHFTYLPAVAPSVAAAALFLLLFERIRGALRRLLLGALLSVLALYVVLTLRMFPVWRSTETFWTRIIEIQPIAINYKERGRNRHLDGRYLEAVADFTAAIELIPETLKPYSYNFLAFRAESLRSAGLYAEAVRDFDAAIAMLPHPVYFHHRGLALKALGRTVEAEQDFSRGGNITYPVVWFDREL